jgi:hypothetical protein
MLGTAEGRGGEGVHRIDHVLASKCCAVDAGIPILHQH